MDLLDFMMIVNRSLSDCKTGIMEALVEYIKEKEGLTSEEAQETEAEEEEAEEEEAEEEEAEAEAEEEETEAEEEEAEEEEAEKEEPSVPFRVLLEDYKRLAIELASLKKQSVIK